MEPTLRFDEMRKLAEEKRFAVFGERAKDLHASDLSDILVSLDPETRLNVVKSLPPELASEALAEMEWEEHPEEVLAALEPQLAANIVDELEDDDAADLIGELSPEKATSILASVDDREEIERLLEYGDDTAGGIMTTGIVSVPETATAGEAIDEIRRQGEQIEVFYHVYCTSGHGVLVGMLPLQRLVRAPAAQPIREIMEPVLAVATPELDQEAVARLIAKYNVASIPVVDHAHRLLGRITFDDVIDVVEAEQTEDILKFGGVPADEALGAMWHEAVKGRLPWLYFNLLTAFLSAAVVSLYLDTIAKYLALAALAPVIAGMGGNAGTQALAVTVRRAALGLIPRERAGAVVAKELLVGLINGLAVGLVVGAVAGALWGGWTFGGVVALAMWGNLMVAGVAGASIPLVLEKVGVDPAVASSVFVTTFTDLFGYFLLLGLASRLIL